MTQSILIPVRTTSASYTVEIGTNLLPHIGDRLDMLLEGALHAGKQRAFVITSPEILRLHGDALLSGLPANTVVLEAPAGEQHKRLSTIESLLEQLAQHGADRDTVLIAFGGGVLGDMTGFLAAIYMRGIRYIQVPTTLLAQVDSSVGGKTGVNLQAGKNLVGAFHHPLAVYADTAALTTLPSAELRAGLQESIKAGIIRDPELFTMLESESLAILSGNVEALALVVAASVRVKADVVGADEREGGLRMILNLGHTLGHALEAATEYKALLHGEAVAWGMLAAIHIAEGRNLVTHAEAERMQRVIRSYGPMRTFTASPETLVALTSKDKKNRSSTRSFVLPKGIGDAVIVRDVTEHELLSAASQITMQAGVAA